VACVTTGAVQNKIDWSAQRFVPVGSLSSEEQLLRPGDVLISTANSKELVGKSCLIGAVPFQCAFGAFVTVLRPKPGVDSVWLSLRLRSPDALSFFFTTSSNTTGISNLRVSDLLGFRVEVPPLEEQRRIAARLTEQLAAVELARKAAEERVHVARRLEHSILRDAFRCMTPLAASSKRDPAPEGWRWVKLGKVARLESGHTPSRSRPDWWGGDIPWIGLPDIRALDGKIVLETIGRTNPDGIANSAARVLPAGTVVLSRTASVGFAAIMGRPMATSQDFVNWVCGEELDPSFLMHLLRASRWYFRSLSSGAVHQTVYMPTLEVLEVCIPSRGAQERIVAAVDDRLAGANVALASAEAELAAIEALPTALLREAFSWTQENDYNGEH
jgi:type I restriction enzyme S subunit